MARETRRKLKMERQRKKERKRIKKLRMEKECLSEKMNCFSHDSSHWRTPPLWNDDPFCFCMNANNNTYSCLRTINQTHNYLYCEFTTGLITFYNLRTGKIDCLIKLAGLNNTQLTFHYRPIRNCQQVQFTIRRRQTCPKPYPQRDGEMSG